MDFQLPCFKYGYLSNQLWWYDFAALNRRWARSEGNGRLLLSVEELGAPYGTVIDSLTWDLR